jgi:ABC-type dipeptide/oligopeptide/nickel transport system permease subunit
MIDDAKLELLRGVWWQFVAATLAVGILCLALSLLGDRLRDVLDPRTRARS